MLVLPKDNFIPFEGEIAKFTLESFPSDFLCPQTGAILNEKLTLNSSGRATITTTEWVFPPTNISEGRWRKKTISKEKTKEIFDYLTDKFRNYQTFSLVTDVGGWNLTLVNNENIKFKYFGSLFSDPNCFTDELSNLIRNNLEMPDLLCFDGGYEPEYIFASVRFGDYGKYYYYQTTDESIVVGDTVIVPVGYDGTERIVEVVEIQRFAESELPMPLHKVKSIIRKCSPIENAFCPICNKDISLDDCYLIAMCAEGLGPKSGYPELVEIETVKANADRCLRCKYHPDGKRNINSFSRNDVIKAHEYSCNNKPALEKDEKCGCFSCLNIFNPKEIDEYLINEDVDCDKLGTAVCPYCSIDSIIGESSGYPITKEFLRAMHLKWFKSGTGGSIETPFGTLKVFVDDKETWVDYESLDPSEMNYPDIDGIYRLIVRLNPNGEEHIVKLLLDSAKVKGEIDGSENLIALSFYEGNGMITIATNAELQEEKTNNFITGNYLRNGLELHIGSESQINIFTFGIAWTEKIDDGNDSQVWNAANPSFLI